MLQEEGTGDAQSEDTLGGWGSEEDALDMMVLPVRDPYLTQEDATLPPAHEDQEEPVMIDNQWSLLQSQMSKLMMWLLGQTMCVVQPIKDDLLTDWEAGYF